MHFNNIHLLCYLCSLYENGNPYDFDYSYDSEISTIEFVIKDYEVLYFKVSPKLIFENRFEVKIVRSPNNLLFQVIKFPSGNMIDIRDMEIEPADILDWGGNLDFSMN